MPSLPKLSISDDDLGLGDDLIEQDKNDILQEAQKYTTSTIINRSLGVKNKLAGLDSDL